jgi:hypothetical protein
MSHERIIRELAILQEGQQSTELVANGKDYVIYRQVPTAGARMSLPGSTDVSVPVPNVYPGAPIDLAGLPVGSPFLSRGKGRQNNQGLIQIAGISWQLASYHPHQNGGGGPWDQMRHGFHTYFDHLLSWLERLN